MPAWDALLLAVEVHAQIRVVLAAGELSRPGAAHLARVLDTQLALLPPAGHLVVDLGGVKFFGVAGIEVLRRADDSARAAGHHLHLCGLDPHRALLPRRVLQLLVGFRTHPTLEDALVELRWGFRRHDPSG